MKTLLFRVITTATLTAVLIAGGPAVAQMFGYTACGDHVLKFDAALPAILSDITGFLAVGPAATGVAMSHDGRVAYVTNQFANTIGKYDTGSPTITDFIIVGNGPVGIDVLPGDKELLVALAPSNRLVLADFTSRTVTRNIPVSGFTPVFVKVEPRGRFAYVGYESSAMISVIDLTSLTETGTIATGFGTVGIAFTPAGDKAYVSGAFSNTVSVIDTATSSVTQTLTGLDGPVGIAVTPNGTEVWIANHGSATLPPFSSKISVYSTATDTLTTVLDYPQYMSQPNWIAFTPDGQFAWVTMQGLPEVQVGTGSNSIALFSVGNHLPSRDLTVPPGCSGIAIANPNPIQTLVQNLTAIVDAANINRRLKSLLLAYVNQIPTKIQSLTSSQKAVLIVQLRQFAAVLQDLARSNIIPRTVATQIASLIAQIAAALGV